MGQLLRMLVAVAAAALLLVTTPVHAEVVTVTASGAVGSISVRGGTTVLRPGAPVKIDFTFDTGALTTIFSAPDTNVYGINVSNFTATIDGYVFALDTNPSTPPVLIIGRAFVFFDARGQQQALIQQFIFPGLGGSGLPFSFAGGAAGSTLDLTSYFSFGETLPPDPSIAALRDPATANFSRFGYAAAGDQRGQFGFASGDADAVFVPGLAAVPEPGTWAMLILGFAVIGGAMRRRVPRPPTHLAPIA